GDAVHVEHRLGPEVADPGLNREPSVRLDDQQAVEADRASRVGADRDADATHLRSDPLTAAALALLVVEQLGAFVERLLQERAGDGVPLSARVRTPELAPPLRA